MGKLLPAEFNYRGDTCAQSAFAPALTADSSDASCDGSGLA